MNVLYYAFRIVVPSGLVMENARLNQIVSIVRTTLVRDFDNVQIVDVDVQEGVDRDGDDVLRIQVVFDGDRKDVDARKLSGAVRQVLPKLREVGEGAFPLFSFVARGDMRRARFEPA